MISSLVVRSRARARALRDSTCNRAWLYVSMLLIGVYKTLERPLRSQKMSHPTPSGADNSRSIFLCFMVLRCLVTVCCRFPQTTPPATAHCTNQRRQGDGNVSQWALQGQDGLTIMEMSKSPGLVLGHENVCLEPPENVQLPRLTMIFSFLCLEDAGAKFRPIARCLSRPKALLDLVPVRVSAMRRMGEVRFDFVVAAALHCVVMFWWGCTDSFLGEWFRCRGPWVLHFRTRHRYSRCHCDE